MIGSTPRESASSGRFAGPLFATLVALAALALPACESEPCVGAGCPRTCFDPSCETLDAPPLPPAASGGSGGTITGGRFTPCDTSSECDVAHGFACVLGECRYPCHSHFDCAGTGPCTTLPGSARTLGSFCAPLPEPTPTGGYYTACPTGGECAAGDGFLCLGAGVGDLEAYCSAPCGSDGDCPSGFLCDDVRTGEGVVEQYCVRRGFCSSCETDADCLAMADQVCARDRSGTKICTKRCDAAVDGCPWGNAAECGIWDSELGVATCSHRFGSCRGEGNGCEPCVTNDDCPAGFCNRSGFTEERWCVDLTVDCSCAGLVSQQGVCNGNNGCPRSPGDVPMLCYDDPRDTTSIVAQHCFAGDSVTSLFASPQAGCWKR